MTNFSPDRPAWRQRITREGLLVTVPALFGLVLAGVLFAALGWQALERIAQQRQRIAVLESKRDTLPLLEAQFKQSSKALTEAMQQQARLVDLVAGRGQIQTFLAQLSRISAASAVEIKLYEPVPASSPEASNRRSSNNQKKKKADSDSVSNDPLQALGYEKSSVLLQVEGPYRGLLQFLRRMEQLELLVQPSDLELTALEEPPADGDQLAVIGAPRTRLKLRLTFFDAALSPGDAADSKSKAPGKLDQRQNTLRKSPS